MKSSPPLDGPASPKFVCVSDDVLSFERYLDRLVDVTASERGSYEIVRRSRTHNDGGAGDRQKTEDSPDHHHIRGTGR